MKTKIKNIGKILLIISITLFLAACDKQIENKATEKGNTPISSEQKEISKDLLKAVESARESEKAVDLVLETESVTNEKLVVKILLKNPDEAQINSVRSFLAYNPQALQGEQIVFPEDSPFTLVAPGEDSFDELNGIAKIGVSVSTEPITQTEVVVAKISFKRLNQSFTTVDFYDPQDGGHTEVLGIFSGHLKNLLNSPEAPGLVIESAQKTENQ